MSGNPTVSLKATQQWDWKGQLNSKLVKMIQRLKSIVHLLKL